METNSITTGSATLNIPFVVRSSDVYAILTDALMFRGGTVWRDFVVDDDAVLIEGLNPKTGIWTWYERTLDDFATGIALCVGGSDLPHTEKRGILGAFTGNRTGDITKYRAITSDAILQIVCFGKIAYD